MHPAMDWKVGKTGAFGIEIVSGTGVNIGFANLASDAELFAAAPKMAERIEALEVKCALLSACLVKADARRDEIVAILRRVADDVARGTW